MLNEAKWASISKQDQVALEALFGEALARRVGKVFDAADTVGVAEMKKAGVAISVPAPQLVSDVRNRVQPLEQQWISAAAGKGVDGAAAMKALRDEIAVIEAVRP